MTENTGVMHSDYLVSGFSTASGLTAPRISSFQTGATRVLDILGAATLLAILFPLLIVIALVVYACDPGPVFFAHTRIGKDGRPFRCFKFRSMVIDAQARLEDLLKNDPEARLSWERDHKLKNDPRVTAIGNFLRKSSCDELPQLLNVLRGEMSLVGPRPVSLEEGTRYGRYLSEYASVRPGITGLWQISGRNNVSYRRRVALDVSFARSYSVELYVRILVMTVPAVLLARGSY